MWITSPILATGTEMLRSRTWPRWAVSKAFCDDLDDRSVRNLPPTFHNTYLTILVLVGPPQRLLLGFTPL